MITKEEKKEKLERYLSAYSNAIQTQLEKRNAYKKIREVCGKYNVGDWSWKEDTEWQDTVAKLNILRGQYNDYAEECQKLYSPDFEEERLKKFKEMVSDGMSSEELYESSKG